MVTGSKGGPQGQVPKRKERILRIRITYNHLG